MRQVELIKQAEHIFKQIHGWAPRKRKLSNICDKIIREYSIKFRKPIGLPFQQGILRNYIMNGGKIILPIEPFSLTKAYCSKKERDTNKVLTKKQKVNVNYKTQPDYSFIKKKFYESPEWRSLRYEVLKEQGARCCLCGRTAKDGVVLHVDHIIPLSKDWSRRLDKDNLQVLCEDCNLGKSNKDCIDWR